MLVAVSGIKHNGRRWSAGEEVDIVDSDAVQRLLDAGVLENRNDDVAKVVEAAPVGDEEEESI